MPKNPFAILLLCFVVASPASSETTNTQQIENPEMAKIFAEDQAIRAEISQRGGWIKVKDDKEFLIRWQSEDAARLARTMHLLRTGAVKQGVDYYRAAFIYQHGQGAENYLKAHHLAVISLSLGYERAKWISAATLDRYLQSVGKPQIYGTQYQNGSRSEPFHANLVSDIERKELNVPTVEGSDAPP